MGTFFRVVMALLLAGLVIGIGAGIYNAGVSAGLAEAARVAEAGEQVVAPYAYGYGPYWNGGFGFGFFWIFGAVLGFFLIIAFVRAAVGWGRWGNGGPGGPGGWGGRRERLEEMHRELHRRDAEGSTPAG